MAMITFVVFRNVIIALYKGIFKLNWALNGKPKFVNKSYVNNANKPNFINTYVSSKI
jgi:hypothetical protein